MFLFDDNLDNFRSNQLPRAARENINKNYKIKNNIIQNYLSNGE